MENPKHKGYKSFQGELVEEEPLVIRIGGHPYAVIMRTPGNEIAHAAGFCLAEGVIDTPDDVGAIGYCNEMEGNVITVTLAPARRRGAAALLKRKGFISQTSCGICGKELLEDLRQILVPSTDQTRITPEKILSCASQLPRHQDLYKRTGASHAAILFNKDGDRLAMGQDVGRHNALDKAIGEVFLAGRLTEACICVLSSRMSYELVQKAARAKLPILVGLSRPTALAVKLGEQMNMTLAWLSKREGLFVFCGNERFESG